MSVISIVLVVIALAFGLVVFSGAPYLPTMKRQAKTALDLLELKPGQHLLELGSGDGRVLLVAAQQGIHATGYELNPLLVMISKIRTWKYRKHVQVRWRNFWRGKWPETDAIFVFLLPKYMKKLDNKIVQEYKGKDVKLASFAFEIPDRNTAKKRDGIFFYLYK